VKRKRYINNIKILLHHLHLQPRNTLHRRRLPFPGCQPHVVLQVQLGLGVVLPRCKVNEQIILDREDGIVGHIRVVSGVDLCGDGLVTLGRHHEMDVSGTHGVAVESCEECSSGAYITR
jgi:hypothetical protein